MKATGKAVASEMDREGFCLRPKGFCAQAAQCQGVNKLKGLTGGRRLFLMAALERVDRSQIRPLSDGTFDGVPLTRSAAGRA